jgi:hypothetical protein
MSLAAGQNFQDGRTVWESAGALFAQPSTIVLNLPSGSATVSASPFDNYSHWPVSVLPDPPVPVKGAPPQRSRPEDGPKPQVRRKSVWPVPRPEYQVEFRVLQAARSASDGPHGESPNSVCILRRASARPAFSRCSSARPSSAKRKRFPGPWPVRTTSFEAPAGRWPRFSPHPVFPPAVFRMPRRPTAREWSTASKVSVNDLAGSVRVRVSLESGIICQL